MPSTAHLSTQVLIIFYLLPLSISSALPSLLSLKCTPPSHKTLTYDDILIQVLLDNLTSSIANNRFITSSIILRLDQFNGLLQCRPDLSSTNCTICAQNARHTVSTLCPNSDAATAWFDGCYLQYHHSYGKSSHANLETANLSCSNQTNTVVEEVQFETALETLLVRLRAEISLPTHLRFSNGELKYGNGGKVYGLAECVRFLSPKECEICVGEAIKKLQEYCGGKEGGTVVGGYCVVRFESYRFFSHVDAGGSDSGRGSDSGGGSGAVGNWESGNEGCMGFKVKVALAWGVGVACLGGVVLSAWLLRRSVINTAKVATFGSAYDDEMRSKEIT